MKPKFSEGGNSFHLCIFLCLSGPHHDAATLLCVCCDVACLESDKHSLFSDGKKFSFVFMGLKSFLPLDHGVSSQALI